MAISLSAIPLGVVFFAGLPVYPEWKDSHPLFRSQMTLSIEQIRRVAGAVANYEKSNQRRPVLLCTIVTRKRGEPLLAVMNDYRTVELSPKELRAALQRTYSYLGGQIACKFLE